MKDAGYSRHLIQQLVRLRKLGMRFPRNQSLTSS